MYICRCRYKTHRVFLTLAGGTLGRVALHSDEHRQVPELEAGQGAHRQAGQGELGGRSPVSVRAPPNRTEESISSEVNISPGKC